MQQLSFIDKDLSSSTDERFIKRLFNLPYGCGTSIQLGRHRKFCRMVVSRGSKSTQAYYRCGIGDEIEFKLSTYTFKARNCKDPHNNSSTMILSGGALVTRTYENDDLNVNDTLKKLQADVKKVAANNEIDLKTPDGVKEYYKLLYDNMGEAYLNMRGVRYEIMSMDLPFKSVYKYVFENEEREGYLNVIVIASAGHGKSTTWKKLSKLYGTGKYYDADISSKGMKGGAIFTKEGVKHDFGALVSYPYVPKCLDEMQRKRPSFFREMNNVVDGYEVNKDVTGMHINKEAASAITWCFNPPENFVNVSQGTSGIRTLKEMVQFPDVIRRYTYPYIASNDNKKDVINVAHGREKPLHYDGFFSDLHNVIQWHGLRKKVIFADIGVENRVLAVARILVNKYAYSEIPFVQKETMRLKVAVVAHCLSGGLANFKKGNLVTESCHVDAAGWFIDTVLERSGLHNMTRQSLSILTDKDKRDVVFEKMDKILKSVACPGMSPEDIHNKILTVLANKPRAFTEHDFPFVFEEAKADKNRKYIIMHLSAMDFAEPVTDSKRQDVFKLTALGGTYVNIRLRKDNSKDDMDEQKTLEEELRIIDDDLKRRKK